MAAASAAEEAREEALRSLARRIFQVGCKAVEPATAVLNAVKLHGNTLQVRDECISLTGFDDILVVGAGKASIAMVEALEKILGKRITRGVVVTKYGHAEGHTLSSRFEVFEAAHPTPDELSLAATGRVLEVAEAAGPRTLVLCCVSGGSSALLCAPAAGLSLAEKHEATKQLLGCGCPVHEKNAVLKHLSRVKGGQLLCACRPARVVTLVLSDVVGDPLDSIGSGPTVPDPWTFADCMKVLENYHLKGTFPKACLEHLDKGVRGLVPDTPKAPAF